MKLQRIGVLQGLKKKRLSFMICYDNIDIVIRKSQHHGIPSILISTAFSPTNSKANMARCRC